MHGWLFMGDRCCHSGEMMEKADERRIPRLDAQPANFEPWAETILQKAGNAAI